MEYGDWNNVKSLRFAWNAAGRSLSANMEFLTQNRKCWISEHYAFGGRRMPSSARGTGFSAMQERLFGQTEEALWGHETGFSVTGEGSGKCLKMGKRGGEKAETGRL